MGLRHLPWPRTLNWPAQLLGDTSGLGSLIFSAKLNFFIPFTPVILGSCTSSWPGFAGVFVFCFGTLKFSLRYSLSSGRSGLLRWQLAWFAWVSGSGFFCFVLPQLSPLYFYLPYLDTHLMSSFTLYLRYWLYLSPWQVVAFTQLPADLCRYACPPGKLVCFQTYFCRPAQMLLVP